MLLKKRAEKLPRIPTRIPKVVEFIENLEYNLYCGLKWGKRIFTMSSSLSVIICHLEKGNIKVDV